MDMSVKLSLSYPAVAAAGKTQDVAPALSVEKDKEPQRPELENAVKNIQDFVQSTRRQLNFSIDDSTGLVVVKVIATDSGELIRQLPSEAALKLAQSLSDASSLLFDDKA